MQTLVNHAKGIYTVNPKYFDASSSTLRDADRFGDLLRARAAASDQSSSAASEDANPVQDDQAKWWRLRQMQEDQPAAWVSFMLPRTECTQLVPRLMRT